MATYNAVVSACARCAQPERAFAVAAEMAAAGVAASSRTTFNLLSACASAGLSERAEALVAQLRAGGTHPDAYVHATRIDCAAREAAMQLHANDAAAAKHAAASLRRCAVIADEARAAASGGESASASSASLPRVVFNALLGAHVTLRDYDGATALYAAAAAAGTPLSGTSHRHAIVATLHRAAAAPVAQRAAALTQAVQLYDSAIRGRGSPGPEARSVLINAALMLVGAPPPHGSAAADVARLVLGHHTTSGFVSTADGSAWLLRAAAPEAAASGGLALAHTLWDELASNSRTPSAAACDAYGRALEATGQRDARRLAAVRAAAVRARLREDAAAGRTPHSAGRARSTA